MAKTLKITQVRSAIGRQKVQKVTLRTLGIKKMNHSVEHKDTPQIRGMINRISHLLQVEEV